jgi:hypothetical protein|tara:strand:- start:356 stop:604 length:249 start_codon:yes stop_codon:yes gene_type:complete
MEAIAALIGAITTLIIAFFAKKQVNKKQEKKRDLFVEKFVQDLNIQHSNVVILNIDKSEIEKPFKFESEANLKKDKLLIILK